MGGVNKANRKLNVAENLLNKIGQKVYSSNIKVKRSADGCISDLLDYIIDLKNRHVKKDYNKEHLMANVFIKPKVINNQCEILAYYKANLVVAADYFERLVARMRSNNKNVTVKMLASYSDELIGFLFDFAPMAEYLERRNDPLYRFILVAKDYSVHSRQLFRLSLYLSGQSGIVNHPVMLDFKSSQIASIFVLRQALELKFQRIVGVKVFDRIGRGPKLKHSFHYDFIANSIKYFDFVLVDFTGLQKIYEWCNSVVHLAFQPYQWQTDYALQNCSGLFAGGGNDKDVAFHPDGAVVIRNVKDMQREFCQYFSELKRREEAIYCLSCENPEALVDNSIGGRS